MLGYATFGVKDYAKSVKFYENVLAPLGYVKFHDEGVAGFAIEGNPNNPGSVWVSHPYNGEEAVPSNGSMVGFMANSRAAVRAFYDAALNNGGTCEGPPGIREAYGPNFYLAYIRDPIGNKMSAMCLSESE